MHWSSVPLASRMNSTASRPRRAAGIGRDVMRLGLHALARIGHGDGETDFAHGRQIDDVVADVANFVERDAFFRNDFADGLHLEGAALIDKFELEVAGARGHSFADALGDDAAFHAAEASQRDGCAVVRAVAFGLDHGGRVHAEADRFLAAKLLQKAAACGSAGDKPDGAVGPYAIDVEENDFDFAGAVDCGLGRSKCHVVNFIGACRGQCLRCGRSRDNVRYGARRLPARRSRRQDSNPKTTTSRGR